MVEQGALDNPRPDAMFALHIIPDLPSGTVGCRSGPLFASSDVVRIKVKGKQTMGAKALAAMTLEYLARR